MLKQDKSNTRLKAMKLQCILYARTTRSQFRYPWNDFNVDDLDALLFILHCHCRLYLLVILAIVPPFHLLIKDICISVCINYFISSSYNV